MSDLSLSHTNHNYYPTVHSLQNIHINLTREQENVLLLKPGYLAKTNQLSSKKSIKNRHNLIKKYHKTKNPQFKKQLDNLIRAGLSLEDVNDDLYNRINHNPNTFSFWGNSLKQGLIDTKSIFKFPETKVLQLPIEMAQYVRRDFVNEQNNQSRQLFNKLLFNKLDLDENKEYFMKLGNFSSKFEFQNAHIDDPKAIGDYVNVVANFAQSLNANLSNEVVIREYIPNSEKLPTIYDGMPLRTEFRCFVDFDLDEIIDIVPYWNPIVMKRFLQMNEHTHINSNAKSDYQTYLKHEDHLMNDYNQHVNYVRKNLKTLIKSINLKGRWSLDIMKDRDDFYVIDMALMAESALTELINPEKQTENINKRNQKQLPIQHKFENAWVLEDDFKSYQKIATKLTLNKVCGNPN